MRLSKSEIICIREVLKPLHYNEINTRYAHRLLLNATQTGLYNTIDGALPLDRLKEISDSLCELSKEQLIDTIHKCQESLAFYVRADRMIWDRDSIATLALIKSGIRFGLQDNTHILIEGISYVKEKKIDIDIFQALMGVEYD